MQAETTREYRIAPELRRCCWYVLASVPLMPAIAVGEILAFGRILHDPQDVVVGCLLILFLVLPLIAVLRWRLTLGPEGLARRRLEHWDRWSWSDLASGRIGKVHPMTLVDPERPWWRRQLSLGYLSEADRHEVLTELNQHYRLPPPPEVPESLTIRYGWRRRATLDSTGIHLLASRTHRHYVWSDVQKVYLIRIDPMRRDFARLGIALPDQEIELRFTTAEDWTTRSEQINECLVRHVPQDRIVTDLASELPKRRIFLEKDLARAKRDLLVWRITIAFLFFAYSGMGMMFWANREIEPPISLVVCLVLAFLGLWCWADRSRRKDLAKLQATVEATVD